MLAWWTPVAMEFTISLLIAALGLLVAILILLAILDRIEEGHGRRDSARDLNHARPRSGGDRSSPSRRAA